MTNKGGTSTSATYSLDSTNSRVVATIPANGYYNTSSKLYATYATVRSLIGLTASKIVSGNTILGISGTASSLPNSYTRITSSSTAWTWDGISMTGFVVGKLCVILCISGEGKFDDYVLTGVNPICKYTYVSSNNVCRHFLCIGTVSSSTITLTSGNLKTMLEAGYFK